MQGVASYAFHHKLISVFSRKLRAVLGHTISYAKNKEKEKALRAEEAQASNPSGIRMRPPTQASDGRSSGGIDYGRHPSPTSKGGKGRRVKEREASEPTFPAIPPREDIATKIQAAANMAPATGISTKYYSAGKSRSRKPDRGYN